MNLWTAFKKEFLEQRRTKKLLIAVVLLAAWGMLSPLLAKLMPEIFAAIPGMEAFTALIPTPTVNDAVAQYVKNLTQFGVLLALLFSMGAVAQEKDKGTAAMILSKPMPRSSFVLSKFLGISLTFLLAMAAAALGGYYYTYFLFEALPVGAFLGMNGLLLIYMLVYTAVTLFFSTLTRTQFVSIGGAAGVLIVFNILGAIPKVGKVIPEGLISNATALGLGQPVNNWWCLWVSLLLITAVLGAAWLAFRKQEV